MKLKNLEQTTKLYLLKLFSLFFSGKQYSRPESGSLKKILIIRQDNRIGNLLFITPLIQMINQVTGVKPDIICGGSFNEIFTENPLVGRVIVYAQKEFIKKPWKFISFIRALRKERYDLVIDCKKVFSFNNALLTMISKKYRIGFKNRFSSLYLDQEYDFSDLNHNLHESILLALPAADFFGISHNSIPYMNYSLTANDLSLPEKYLAIHIGGRGNKSISALLVNQMIEAFTLWYSGKIIVIYGPDELDKAQSITNQHQLEKIRPADIRQLAQWINGCEIFITPDTGPLHIASALNKKIAALFSVTPSLSYGPRTQARSLIVDLNGSDGKEIAEKIKEFYYLQ